MAFVRDHMVHQQLQILLEYTVEFQYIHIYDKTDNIITLLFLIEYSSKSVMS